MFQFVIWKLTTHREIFWTFLIDHVLIFDDRTLWLTCESKRCLYDYNTTAIKICLDTKIRNARTTIWQFFVSLIRYIWALIIRWHSIWLTKTLFHIRMYFKQDVILNIYVMLRIFQLFLLHTFDYTTLSFIHTMAKMHYDNITK